MSILTSNFSQHHRLRARSASAPACLLLLIIPALYGQLPIQSTNSKPFVEQVNPPLFGFYAKDVICDGIHIRGAANVQDQSLLRACARVELMLAKIDVVRQNLAQRGVELHLIAVSQNILSLPEYADRKEDKTLQGARERPGIYIACGEEAFAEPATGEHGIDPCTAEFALAILRYGYDTKIRDRIAGEYRDAVKAGLWTNAPAGASPEQYWAELSAWYFGGHGTFLRAENPFPAPGPLGLRQYDPQGYELLKLLYNGMDRPLAIEAIRARNVSKLAISQASSVPAQLQLVNNGPQTLRLFWIDIDGVTRSVGVLGPYRRAIEDTFLSNVWMVEDQRGVEIGRFVVDDPVSEVIATN